MTQCNAGALATGGIGTALGVIQIAVERGKKLHILVPETRPYLQGARLTAWELHRSNIPLTLITDNMVGHFLKQGNVGAIVTGADRIAANGDTANKIGTYQIAVLAREHNVPFYIAAPVSTFDLSIASGDQIPIEERSSAEVTNSKVSALLQTFTQRIRIRRNAQPLHHRHFYRARRCKSSLQRIAESTGRQGRDARDRVSEMARSGFHPAPRSGSHGC